MLRFLYASYCALALTGCELYLGDDRVDDPSVDGAVVVIDATVDAPTAPTCTALGCATPIGVQRDFVCDADGCTCAAVPCLPTCAQLGCASGATTCETPNGPLTCAPQ